MFQLITTDIYLACVVACVAGSMRGFAGFGSGMLMAPVFAVIFGPIEAVVIIILLEMAATLQIMPSVKNNIEWPFVSLMGIVAMVFMPLGMWLLISLDPLILTRSISLIVAIFVLILISGWSYEGKKSDWLTAGIGAISGMMMAATSLGNPIVILYMLTGNKSSVVNRSNITAYFSITLSAMFVFMIFTGLLTQTSALRAFILLPLFLVFTWLGSHLFRKSNELLYKKITLSFLFFASLVGLFS